MPFVGVTFPLQGSAPAISQSTSCSDNVEILLGWVRVRVSSSHSTGKKRSYLVRDCVPPKQTAVCAGQQISIVSIREHPFPEANFHPKDRKFSRLIIFVLHVRKLSYR